MDRSINVEEIISILGERIAKLEVELAISVAKERKMEEMIVELTEGHQIAPEINSEPGAPTTPDFN